VNSPSQKGDSLKAVLKRAREATPRPVGKALPGEGKSDARDLVDRNAALPDPRALARLYQSDELRRDLPGDEVQATDSERTPGWEAPADAATRPSMTPAELRAVMTDLAERFKVSADSYETYSLSSRPYDDYEDPHFAEARERERVEIEEAIARVEAAARGEWVYLLGAVLALAVVLLFIFLALNGVGPFKTTPAPNPPPVATASPR
jgi:hypothetical protein